MTARQLAVHQAKGLYSLALKRGIYQDRNGFIDCEDDLWIARVPGFIVYLRSNGALDHVSKLPFN